nr:hypothetical protein [Roseovarius sp. W115]MDV2929893.1 hypothetical protein [Roseovarius sp. W115]
MRGSVSDVLSKIAILFLVFMAILAMFGRLRFPGQKKLQSAKCSKCGRFRIGKGRCPCGKDGRA